LPPLPLPLLSLSHFPLEEINYYKESLTKKIPRPKLKIITIAREY